MLSSFPTLNQRCSLLRALTIYDVTQRTNFLLLEMSMAAASAAHLTAVHGHLWTFKRMATPLKGKQTEENIGRRSQRLF